MSFIFLTLWTPVQLGADLMPLGWAVEALLLLAIALGSDERLRIGRWIVLVMATSVQLVEIAAGPSDRFRDWVRADDPVARCRSRGRLHGVMGRGVLRAFDERGLSGPAASGT